MPLNIQKNVKLAAYTTLNIGGVAQYLVSVQSEVELLEAISMAKENNLPMLFLGGGSNVLIADEGFSGLVVLNNLKGIKVRETEIEVYLTVKSGEILDDVIEFAVESGYFGLENLSDIPGSVGAAPIQNVGAYGTEMKDVVEEVRALNIITGKKKIFTKADCNFGYRDSWFKGSEGKNFFILEVCIVLKKNNILNVNYPDLKKYFSDQELTLKKVREAVKKIRSKKFPNWKEIGTAGSFFKNPVIKKSEAQILRTKFPDLPQYNLENGMVKIPLGYVLDKLCGLKGYKYGSVGLYSEQALVLVNLGGANFNDVKTFVDQITIKVYQKTNLEIQPEVNFIKNNF